MPEQEPYGGRPEHRDDETVRPSNPPNSVLRPAVRRKAVRTYVGILVAVFAIAGIALLVWQPLDGNRLPDGQERPEASAAGTSGERMAQEDTPGGFDPAPDPRSTEGELEFRGSGDTPQMPGQTSPPLTGLGSLRDERPESLVGRHIELENVAVEASDAGRLRVRDGDRTMTVVAPRDVPTMRGGQRADVSGIVERDSEGSLQIRASRIELR